MELPAYLAATSLTRDAFAGRLGITVETLESYVLGRRKPPLEIVAAIERESQGAVLAGDLMAIGPSNDDQSESPDTKTRTGLDEARAILRSYVEPGHSLADELIRERRAAAAIGN